MDHLPIPILGVCLLAYLVLLIVMAAVLSRRMLGLTDFFLAGRNLSLVPIALAFVASWFGAGSTMGTLNEAYQHGLGAMWLIAVPAIISCLVIILFLAKPIRQLNSTSQPEAIENQYGPVGSFLFSWVIFATTTVFAASQLVAARGLLDAVLPAVPSLWAIGGLMGAIMLYSVIGGFRAVVMTDVMQFVCFTLAILILFGFTCLAPGTPFQYLRLPHGFWDLWQGIQSNWAMLLTFVLAWSVAPEMWQRMSATQSERDAQRAALLACILLAGLYALVIGTGLLTRQHLAHYEGNNALVPLAMLLPYPFLTAMVFVGVLSAITSTIDSTLNVGSLAFTRDIVNRFLWPQATPGQLVLLGRISTILIAVTAVAIAMYQESIIQVLWFSADIYASTLFVPIVGLLYWPRAGQWCGTLAMVLGGIPVILGILHYVHWLSLPSWWPDYPYTTLIGVGLSLIGFLLGLLLPGTVREDEAIDLAAEEEDARV